ncbi:monocarboxylate transporter 12-like [Ruditapes philippinarum]|uniref:monocarboxylate transporter 12-like n=1 Tax=Ruditapes philippinarum TaxID=129788 RepID=UPI00295B2419|nr:monocarboxylate transporter 12-like [Ruditapes philippinarum]
MICDVTDRRVDGCYGWIVVMSGFCLIVLTDGILFTFGNLLIELTEYFDADRARIALVGALMLGFSCLTGPISGGLCDRFGCRMVAVTGAVLSSVSLLISSFATNVTYLYLTYGVLGVHDTALALSLSRPLFWDSFERHLILLVNERGIEPATATLVEKSRALPVNYGFLCHGHVH